MTQSLSTSGFGQLDRARPCSRTKVRVMEQIVRISSALPALYDRNGVVNMHSKQQVLPASILNRNEEDCCHYVFCFKIPFRQAAKA